MHAPLRRGGWIAFGLALAVLLSACGSEPEPGVGVRAITTELAFGVPEEDPIPAAPSGMAEDEEDETVPVVVEEPPRPPPDDDGDREPAPEVEMCPEAPLTAAPEEVAPSVVEEEPVEGRYRWMVEGSGFLAGIGRISLDGMRTRMIRDVEETDEGFRYTVQETEIRVNNPALVRTTYEVERDEETGEGGIYITEIYRRSQEREGTFNPAPPVLVFPLPAQIGESPAGVGVHVEEEQMDTTGVDPTTQEALRHSGTIVGREHIDACGELVDAYYVEAMQEFVSGTGESYQRKFDYAVATHMGGIIIFEDVQRPCSSVDEDRNCSPEPEDRLEYEARIGQLEPDPLPDEDEEDEE